MKIRKNLLKILTLLILSGNIINAGYIKEKNKIYFTDEATEPERKEIVKNVDFRTFKIFEENDDFASDKNNIYYKNKKLENVDVNSFQIENPFIVKDKDNVFYITNNEIIKIKGFSPEKSKVIVQFYVPTILINKNGIYTFDKYENGEITIKSIKPARIDMNTLEVVDGENMTMLLYLKDKNNVYFINYKESEQKISDIDVENAEDAGNDNYNIDIEIKKLESADSGSFKIDSIYGKDKNNLYFLNKKITGVNPKTFKVVGSNKLIIKDDKGVYYLGREEVKKIQNADLNTFEEVSKEYYRDKNNVFYYDNYDGDVKRVKGADAKSFEVIDGYAIGRDKNAVYDRGKQIKGLDPLTFEDLSGNFYKDKNGVYYEGMLMKGIDPKSFEPFVNYTHVKDKNGIHHFYQKGNNVVVEKVEISPEIDLKTLQPIENYSEYSKDKNNVYYNFKKIEDADVKTFEPEGYSIGKDKTGVYYGTHKVSGVDVNSLEVLKNDFFKDKNNIYYKNKKIENFKPKNFEVIDYSLVKQNEDLYYFTEDENDNTKFVLLESKNVDIDTFQILDEDYTKDKNNAYYKGKIFKEADVKTLDKHYNKNDDGYKIRDKKKVYKIKNK